MYIKASEGLNKVLSARQQRRRLSLITGVKQSVMQSMDIVSRKLSPVFLVLLVVGFALFVRIAVSLNSFSGEYPPLLAFVRFFFFFSTYMQVRVSRPCMETTRLRGTGWRSPTIFQSVSGTCLYATLGMHTLQYSSLYKNSRAMLLSSSTIVFLYMCVGTSMVVVTISSTGGWTTLLSRLTTAGCVGRSPIAWTPAGWPWETREATRALSTSSSCATLSCWQTWLCISLLC